jgi:hypothetical protein
MANRKDTVATELLTHPGSTLLVFGVLTCKSLCQTEGRVFFTTPQRYVVAALCGRALAPIRVDTVEDALAWAIDELQWRHCQHTPKTKAV